MAFVLSLFVDLFFFFFFFFFFRFLVPLEDCAS